MAFALPAANYIGWLGWDQSKDINPVTKVESGPYQWWQVVGLVLVLALYAAYFGWKQHPELAVLGATVVMTAATYVDWSTDPNGDGLFLLGVIFWAIATFLGSSAVAWPAASVARKVAHARSADHGQ